MKVSDAHRPDNYFEDFKVGEMLSHARGKTVEPLEQVWITNLMMNTAQAHFNEHLMKSTATGASGSSSAASPSRCASGSPRRTRPRMRWWSSAWTRSG